MLEAVSTARLHQSGPPWQVTLETDRHARGLFRSGRCKLATVRLRRPRTTDCRLVCTEPPIGKSSVDFFASSKFISERFCSPSLAMGTSFSTKEMISCPRNGFKFIWRGSSESSQGASVLSSVCDGSGANLDLSGESARRDEVPWLRYSRARFWGRSLLLVVANVAVSMRALGGNSAAHIG